ncbi:MAG: DoxX family membrane protein [Patescibacteria group bacterium]|nr:DoxX family membrane protein [Patescibacteria group bacterium]
MQAIEIPEPKISRFLFADARFSWFWLIVRVYVGWQWIVAGAEKMRSASWVGSAAGSAVKGFFLGALQQAGGIHPNVSGWYAYFILHVALPNAAFFSYLVTYGELVVGLALIIGLFTGIAAFFGAFMNMNYLLAAAVSINPLMLLLEILLILAWRTAGWLGVDYYLLPAVGVPWQTGKLFHKR